MSTSSGSGFGRKQQRELSQLKNKARRRVVGVLVPLGIIIVVVLLFSSGKFHGGSGQTKIIDTAWTQSFQTTQLGLRDWLLRRGTDTEVALFDTITEALFVSGISVSSRERLDEPPSFLSQFLLTLHIGALRLAFTLLASWRIWIVLIAGAFIYGYRGRQKPYTAGDLLGETGNGRLFFSGIRADLSRVDEDGAPDKLIPGLACPKSVSVPTLMGSRLGALLQKHHVANETNVALGAIILAYNDVPAYAPPSGEDGSFAAFFENVPLPEACLYILSAAFSLYDFYKKGDLLSDPPFLVKAPAPAGKGKTSIKEHAAAIQVGFHRALTPRMRGIVSNFSKVEIATLILGFETGKVLGYGKEGNKWVRRSNFVQLSARAVLHSVPSFAKEYAPHSRTMIRQGLIYGSRFSVLGPVRFPINLPRESRAARQWVELLMALPHELQAAISEVELFGAVCELHESWEKAFSDGVSGMDTSSTEGVFGSGTGLLLMPVSKAAEIVRQITPPPLLARLEELVAAVSQMQRIQTMSADFGTDPAGDQKRALPAYQRIFPPLGHQEIKALSDLHGVPVRDVKDWSTFRIVLNSFGWLARRVGNSSVPESSIVFAVLKTSTPGAGVNNLGLLGRKGMIPFRGTKLEDKWGRYWQSRFTEVEAASMAETVEDFERLLAGQEDVLDDDQALLPSSA